MTRPEATADGVRSIALDHPLILVRHGETDWNVAGRLQGHEDIPLNDRGRIQARRNGAQLGRRFARSGVDPAGYRFIASPLARATDTMRLLRREMGLDADGFTTDARLIELGYGRWAGLEFAEVAAADPHGHAAHKHDRWNSRPPGGESMADGAERVAPLLAELDGPAVIVTHGGLIRVMHVLLGLVELRKARHVATPQDRLQVISGGVVQWV